MNSQFKLMFYDTLLFSVMYTMQKYNFCEIKAKNLKLLSNAELEKFYLEFFDGVLRSSKDYQYDLIEDYQKKNL